MVTGSQNFHGMEFGVVTQDFDVLAFSGGFDEFTSDSEGKGNSGLDEFLEIGKGVIADDLKVVNTGSIG